MIWLLIAVFLWGCNSQPIKPNQQIEPYFFLVPKVGNGAGIQTRYCPKYLCTEGVADTIISCRSDFEWNSMDLGLEPYFFVVAELAQIQRDSLAERVDVVAFPANIDVTIENLEVVKQRLEMRYLPSNWVGSSATYRQLIRYLCAITAFHQRFNSLHGAVFKSGIDLSTQFNQLPQRARDKIQQTADELQFDRSGLTGSSTLREILRTVGQQWINREVKIGKHII